MCCCGQPTGIVHAIGAILPDRLLPGVSHAMQDTSSETRAVRHEQQDMSSKWVTDLLGGHSLQEAHSRGVAGHRADWFGVDRTLQEACCMLLVLHICAINGKGCATYGKGCATNGKGYATNGTGCTSRRYRSVNDCCARKAPCAYWYMQWFCI